MGCTADLETFRRTLAEVAAGLFPDLRYEKLAFGRDQACDYCSEVKKRLAAPKLTRVFILKAPVGLWKNRKRKAGAKA